MRKKRKGGSADGLDIDVDDFGGAPAHKRDRAAAFSRGGKGGGGKGGGKGGISKKEWKDKKFGHTRGTGSKRKKMAARVAMMALRPIARRLAKRREALGKKQRSAMKGHLIMMQARASEKRLFDEHLKKSNTVSKLFSAKSSSAPSPPLP